MRTDNRLAALLLLASIGVSFLFLLLFWKNELGDYATYWIQAKYTAERPGVDIYDQANQGAINDFGLALRQEMGRSEEPFVEFSITQTPFLTSLICLSSTRDYNFDQRLFNTVNLGIFLFAMTVALRSLGFSVTFSLSAILWVLFLNLPLQSDLGNSNFNNLLVGLLVIATWLSAEGVAVKRFASGFLAGIALMLKPTVAYPILALYFSRLARGRYSAVMKELSGLLAGVAAAMAISAIHFGSAFIWLSWARRIRSLSFNLSPLSSFNLSLPAAIWTHFDRDVSAFTYPLFMVLLLFAVYIRSRVPVEATPDWRSEFSHDLNILGLGCLSFLLGSPLAWLHYYVMCLPTALVLLKDLRKGPLPEKRERLVAASLTTLAIGAVSLWPFRLLFLDLTLLPGFALMWGGAFTLWALGLKALETCDHVPE